MKLTNPNKPLYPENNITKQQVFDYYQHVADWILPYIKFRPLTLVRCPKGYNQGCFYQKHINVHMLPGIKTAFITEKNTEQNYIYIDSVEGLLSLIQLDVLEIHTWGSSIPHVENPDQIIFDLDPAPGIKWNVIVKAVLEIKAELAKIKLKSFVKATGGKGLHVVVPIKPEYSWDMVKIFTQTFIQHLLSKNPDQYTSSISKIKRINKIFIDYLRNQHGATAIAPYSTRAKAGAPLAVPLSWDEITKIRKLPKFTIKNILKRLTTLNKDPWQDFFKISQKLSLE